MMPVNTHPQDQVRSDVALSQDDTPRVESVQMIQPAPRTIRNGKLPRIKRNPSSFRPGTVQPATVPVAQERPLELHFLIPASGPLATAEEAREVHLLAQALSDSEGTGSITSVGISKGTWVLIMRLSRQVVTDHDAYLSEVFRTLMPIIEQLPQLSSGFCVGKSSQWEYRIGSFVADNGGFN